MRARDHGAQAAGRVGSRRDLPDPLITWAVTTARITQTDAQTVSGVSRSTINRLLRTD